MMRQQLDPVLQGLDGDVPMAGSEEDEQALKKQIKSRENALLPMYLQVGGAAAAVVIINAEIKPLALKSLV